jgi:hypothetical protein
MSCSAMLARLSVLPALEFVGLAFEFVRLGAREPREDDFARLEVREPGEDDFCAGML